MTEKKSRLNLGSGIICMMPWDMMVTVNGYWNYKFRNTSLDDVEVNGTEPGLTK